MRLFTEDPGSPDAGRALVFDILARRPGSLIVSERAYGAAMFALEGEAEADRERRRPTVSEVAASSAIRELNARRRKLTGGSRETLRDSR